MADVSPAEQAVKHELFNDADSPPTSPPPPEAPTEEALPEVKAEVKEEVEEPAPKLVRINRNAYGFSRARVLVATCMQCLFRSFILLLDKEKTRMG